jgi:preprotein translocase subunit SecG
MQTVHTLLMVVQVLTAVALIGFILIQQGKGADAGAAFGSGASATVFGARGSGNFLSRTTAVLATVFLVNSLALAWIAKERVLGAGGVMESAVTAPAAPAAPARSVPATDSAVPSAPADDIPGAPVESEVPTAPE